MKSAWDWLLHNKDWVFSGAGIAVLGLLLSLFKRHPPAPKRQDPSLRVSLSFGYLTYEHPSRLSEQMLVFTVANPEDRPVQLTSIRIPLKDANIVFPNMDGERRMPCFVQPGSNLKFWVEASEVQGSLRSRNLRGSLKIRALASDAIGNEHFSNTIEILI